MRHTLIALTVLIAAPAFAAEKPASPPGSAAVELGGKWIEEKGDSKYTGGKWIEVTYGRPVKRARDKLFGSGADYGKKLNAGAPVWRLGANETTRLKTEVALELGGKKIPAGEYSLFVDLKEGAWTLIVSKQPAMQGYNPNDKKATWGSYGYDPSFDVARVPMKTAKPPVSVDQLTIGFADMTNDAGKLGIAWDREGAYVELKLAK